MAKKNFKIRAKLVFNGQVTVQAHSRQESEAIVEKNIAAILSKVEVQRSLGYHQGHRVFPTWGSSCKPKMRGG
jgi:hypothetical protein